MSSSHLVAALIGAALVGAGVAIGSTFSTPSESVEVGSGDRTAAPAPAASGNAPDLMGGGGDLAARLARLERAVKALEQAAALDREAVRPLLALYAQAEEAGVDLSAPFGDEAVLPEPMLSSDAVPDRKQLVDRLVRNMGIAAERGKAFAAEVEGMMAEIERLEAAHAEVTVGDDGKTTIRIPKFGGAGADLARRWSDWTATNLSGPEREALEKQQAAAALFGNRLGAHERTVSIETAGGNITVEEALDGEGASSRTVGPAIARDFVLADYLHILDKER